MTTCRHDHQFWDQSDDTMVCHKCGRRRQRWQFMGWCAFGNLVAFEGVVPCRKRPVAARYCREHVEAELAYAMKAASDYAALLNDCRGGAA